MASGTSLSARFILASNAWLQDPVGCTITALIAGLGLTVSGDALTKVMTDVQPRKMAAAGARYETTGNASFQQACLSGT